MPATGHCSLPTAQGAAIDLKRAAKSGRPALALALGLISVKAAAEIPVGNGVVSLDTSASTTYTTNISAAQDGYEALYFTLAPKMTYARRASLIQSRLEAGLQLERFLTAPRLDSDNVSAAAAMEVNPGVLGRFSGDVRASYAESNQLDYNVNARLATRTTNVSAKGDVVVGQSITAALANAYSRTERNGYPSVASLSSGGSLHFLFGQRSSVFAGYNRLETRTTSTPEIPVQLNQSSDSFTGGITKAFRSGINTSAGAGYTSVRRSAEETLERSPGGGSTSFLFNVNGPILPPRFFPKVTSSFSVAYGRPETLGLYDTGSSQLTGALTLGWAARATTRVHGAVARSRNLAANNLTSDTTSAMLGLTQILRNRLMMSGTVGYDWTTVRGVSRDSETMLASFQMQKALGTRGRWAGSMMYDFRNSTSSVSAADFAQHTVVLSLTYKY